MSLTVVDSFEIVRAEEADEPFQAGSVSKAVAALVAVRLVDSGALELDGDGWFRPRGRSVRVLLGCFGSTEGGWAIGRVDAGRRHA